MRHDLLIGLTIFALGASLAGCACDEGRPPTTSVAEDFTVVEGTPAVDTASPKVDYQVPTTPTFKLNVPRQCDFFQQNAVRKVDILWVVDNSGSMAKSQDNLAREFPRFIESLLALEPPVDFHIGVTSTDTDNAQLVYSAQDVGHPADAHGTKGDLHRFDLGAQGGPSGRFIACDGTGACNVSQTQAAAAFNQMSRVGTGGSALERGLYAAYLALNLPENKSAEAPLSSDLSKKYPFIRPDAALFVVFVSDEDDSSCMPFVPLEASGRPKIDPATGKVPACQADPGCKCDASQLTWGSAQYFIRYLETYKGFAHKDLVAAGAVVCTGTDEVPAQSGDATFIHKGCPFDGNSVAYFGERYIQVAEATGGTAISIRGSFANALQSLGFAVSGMRRDFRLSRGPYTDSLEVYVTEYGAQSCTADAQCGAGFKCRTGKCARIWDVGAVSMQQTCGGAATPAPLEYCRCDDGTFRNILRFNRTGEPPAQSSVEVCYDVNSNLNTACQ